MVVGFYDFYLWYGFYYHVVPVNIDDIRPNHMYDFIYRSCVCSCIVVIKGDSFACVSVSWQGYMVRDDINDCT